MSNLVTIPNNSPKTTSVVISADTDREVRRVIVERSPTGSTPDALSEPDRVQIIAANTTPHCRQFEIGF